ncbi:hypothetical protein CBR_g21994 [Chara braunii]|uniref:CCHC-type domain-containing protein n=1 Tax=Chara braunii TaxID=69332 RepID=A0A388L1P3_CHABU|nr:hypothetical protein CBR_g21994 [Chara braunii]|eukprot:GBG76246.1 hypothetical protein CBR_g21994 [Chara braunii]
MSGDDEVVGGAMISIDDLAEALARRDRARGNVPKVEIFLFEGDRVSEWFEKVEQAMVGVSNPLRFERILQYVHHALHDEIGAIRTAANGEWTKYKDGMIRKYRLGDGLMTQADVEAINRDNYTTVGALAKDFKKKARKVPGISEEEQCAIFLGLFKSSEASMLTKNGEVGKKLTWETIDKGVKEGGLDEVHQYQMGLHRRKRKERDDVAATNQDMRKTIADLLTEFGFTKEQAAQKKVVTIVQTKGKEVAADEFGPEDYGEEETGSQALTKTQRRQRNQLQGGQGTGKGQAPQASAAPLAAVASPSGRNGGGRGGGWNGQGGQGQGGGRPRFDWKNATCWHCGGKGFTIRFCQQMRDDEHAGLISTCMDGDVYDKRGYVIDPRTPGGIRQEAKRRAVAGRSAEPAMFRMWQEREDPIVRVEEVVGENEEVTQPWKAGAVKEEPIVAESDDEGQEAVGEPTLRILERMEDLLEKVGRYQQRLRTMCEEAQQWRANLPGVMLSDFSKEAMQRGGRGARSRQGPQRTSGRGEQHRRPGREPTPEYDGESVVLFLDIYRGHAAQAGWSEMDMMRHLRGVRRFEDPVAQICEEALTWSDIEARMQRLRASPRGRDGMPIRLEAGNAEEFIPAYEYCMLYQGVAWEEWTRSLLIWTRRAERPEARQIRDGARDWEDCQAQLRRMFGRQAQGRTEPRVERRRRSKRLREPTLQEGLHGGGGEAAARQRDEPAEPMQEEEPFPACGLRQVEFRRITRDELRPPSPSPPRQEQAVPGETPFRSLVTHLDASRWEASHLGKDSAELVQYEPVEEEPLELEVGADLRGGEGSQEPEAVAEPQSQALPQDEELITIGDDTPPSTPVPERVQPPWPEWVPEPGSEEAPESLPEITIASAQEMEVERQGEGEGIEMRMVVDLPSEVSTAERPSIEELVPVEPPPVVPGMSGRMSVEESISGTPGSPVEEVTMEACKKKSARVQAHLRYESQRDAARRRSREIGQAGEGLDELRRTADFGFSAGTMAIERLDRRIGGAVKTSFDHYSLLSDDARVRQMEVEQLTAQLAEERARSQAREVEWERRFGELTAVVSRLSEALVASRAIRPDMDVRDHGTQTSPHQGTATEPLQQGAVETGMSVEEMTQPRASTPHGAPEEGPGQGPLHLSAEERGAKESLMTMSTERRGSRLHELAATMGIATPQEGPQRLDTLGHVPSLGGLRAELGSWATESGTGERSSEHQQQEATSEPATMMGAQLSRPYGGETVVETGRLYEGRPQRLDTPEYRLGSQAIQGREGAEATEPGLQGRMGLPSCHEMTTEAAGVPSTSSSKGKKKKTARWFDGSCLWCKKYGHRASDCPGLFDDKASGFVAEIDGKFYDRQGRMVERAPDGGRAQLYRQNQEELIE